MEEAVMANTSGSAPALSEGFGDLLSHRVEEWNCFPAPQGSSRGDPEQDRVVADSVQVVDGTIDRGSVSDCSTCDFLECRDLALLLAEEAHRTAAVQCRRGGRRLSIRSWARRRDISDRQTVELRNPRSAYPQLKV